MRYYLVIKERVPMNPGEISSVTKNSCNILMGPSIQNKNRIGIRMPTGYIKLSEQPIIENNIRYVH